VPEIDPSSPLAADVAAVQGIAATPIILEVVCRTTGMGFAAVARVTSERWVACAVRDEIAFGLEPGGELELETTICNEIRQSGQAVVIDHVAQDAAFCAHPTPAMYGFQSYISVPIVMPGGRFFGTLCAIDRKPAVLDTPATIGMFRLFADLIAFHLDAHERLAASAADLGGERRNAELREQFIAVLGHDLRNPLASIGAGVQLLQRTPLDAKAVQIARMMEASVARMAGLISNVLDFARGRLGGGFAIERSTDPIEPALLQVVAELRASHPERDIEIAFAMCEPVECDGPRVAQLFSNLLANALTHGSPNAPVTARAATLGNAFELSVTNAGDPIPAAIRNRLFQPFERIAGRAPQQGLGLGLYIASEIARAHGGAIEVDSTQERTVFTFRMPLARA
jgi:signal transduction histidine kinase